MTKFKQRIERQGKEPPLEELLVEVVSMARREGVEFGSIQVVDSTHSPADGNVAKRRSGA